MSTPTAERGKSPTETPIPEPVRPASLSPRNEGFSATSAGAGAEAASGHATAGLQDSLAGGSQADIPAFQTMLPGLPGLPYTLSRPDEFARNMLRLIEESSRVMATLIERQAAPGATPAQPTEMDEATRALTELGARWMGDPAKLAQAQTQLMQTYLDLWGNAGRRILGETVAPLKAPEPSDTRFKDGDWRDNVYFDFWKQAYLVTTTWAEALLADTQGLSELERKKAEFYLRQMMSAFSPTNFPMMNPEVLRETFASNAANLVNGMVNLVRDLQSSKDGLRISQTDTSAFEVGRNLAMTPGKVIFQNDILQLIQYTPSTESVHAVPLLIVPPWINKFYILDLNDQKSFVRHVVAQGLTVFVVSWVNPDENLAHKTFEDYMKEGILSATDAVARETGQPKCNVLGYCVGGTLLGCTLAYLAARGHDPYVSATFLTTQVDFSQAGDLLLFIDDKQLAALDAMMAQKGYLEGSAMATVFNMLRPRDLIWPYIVNNYMLGKKPFPFDLLYWNQDSTRMPAANHSFYLHQFYQANKLAKGQMTLAGTRLDLAKVKLPIYELATKEDHIAPAVSVFKGAKLFGGPVEFVLSGSGHIAGVVNPPAKPKYQYWTNPQSCDTLEAFVAGAKETPGSWWPHWTAWLARHSGSMVKAREPGQKLRAIENAPGSYVRVTC